MDRKRYDLRSLIAPEHLTAAVEELLRVEGSILTTDDEGYDHCMEDRLTDERFVIVDETFAHGWGLVQYMYVVDGHLIIAVWFGGSSELSDFSFTFNEHCPLLLLPVDPTTNPCNQHIDANFLVNTVTECWVANKKSSDFLS